MSGPSELLADCNAQGIRLHPAGDGGLTIDGPQAALTPDMLARLKAHKAGLLALLGRAVDMPMAPLTTSQNAPAKPRKPVCRCGSTTWRDFPIHNGQSVRRDCGRCGRFTEFPIWYGKTTGHKDQHPI